MCGSTCMSSKEAGRVSMGFQSFKLQNYNLIKLSCRWAAVQYSIPKYPFAFISHNQWKWVISVWVCMFFPFLVSVGIQAPSLLSGHKDLDHVVQDLPVGTVRTSISHHICTHRHRSRRSHGDPGCRAWSVVQNAQIHAKARCPSHSTSFIKRHEELESLSRYTSLGPGTRSASKESQRLGATISTSTRDL